MSPLRASRTGTASRAAAVMACAVALVAGGWVPTAAAQPTSQEFAPASAVRAASSDDLRTYVGNVYLDLLARAPDAPGLSNWVSMLAAGTPRQAVANAITSSGEYRSRLISESYSTYLDRGPDGPGLASWLTAMNTGVTIQQMEGGFVASPEYFQRAGGTPGGWVSALYADVLDRSAAPAEVDSWVRALSAGANRSEVAMGFLLSGEHLSTVLDGHYHKLLNRGMDPTGQKAWVGAIQGGARIEVVIGGIVASDEYYGANSSTVAAPPPPTVTPVPPPPTVTPVPSGTGCAATPSRCGYPDATNTGVPSGVVLRNVPGQITSGPGWSWDSRGWIAVTGDGAVIDAIATTGSIDVSEASNVMIKNSRITVSGEGWGIALRHASDVTIRDSEISGPSASGSTRLMVGIKDIYGDSSGTWVFRNEIWHTSTGVQIDQGLIEQNYIHTLGKTGDDHVNGTTSNGGSQSLTIRRNTIFNQYDQTDAVSLFQDFGPQANRLIEGNLLAGGGYTIYAGANPGRESTATNIRVLGNRISRMYFPRGGYWGPATAYVSGGGNSWSGNIWDEDGAPISAPSS